jgi:hypothetical protein
MKSKKRERKAIAAYVALMSRVLNFTGGFEKNPR